MLWQALSLISLKTSKVRIIIIFLCIYLCKIWINLQKPLYLLILILCVSEVWVSILMDFCGLKFGLPQYSRKSSSSLLNQYLTLSFSKRTTNWLHNECFIISFFINFLLFIILTISIPWTIVFPLSFYLCNLYHNPGHLDLSPTISSISIIIPSIYFLYLLLYPSSELLL